MRVSTSKKQFCPIGLIGLSLGCTYGAKAQTRVANVLAYQCKKTDHKNNNAGGFAKVFCFFHRCRIALPSPIAHAVDIPLPPTLIHREIIAIYRRLFGLSIRAANRDRTKYPNLTVFPWDVLHRDGSLFWGCCVCLMCTCTGFLS